MAISLSAGGNIQTLHPYYSSNDYFERDRDAGIVRQRTGVRGLHVPEDFIVGLQAGLESEVGDVAGMVLYRAGFEWAAQDMKAFEPRFEQEFGGRTKISEANLMLVLETWWWPLTAEGWGTWRVDLSRRSEGLIVVDLFDSAVAKSLGNIGKPVCFLYAGMLAGVFSYMSKRELSSIEIQCYAMGATFCKFIVGNEKRLNAASFWVKEGAQAQEILSRI